MAVQGAEDGKFLATLHDAKGNVPHDTRVAIADLFRGAAQGRRFLGSITSRLETTEMNILTKPEEPTKKEVKLVFEIDVTEDMTHFGDSMHGGCTASLVDFCSSVALSLLANHVTPGQIMHLSLVLTTTYHAPAPLGCRLKIVNTTVALGGRVGTARIEMYDKTNGRLIASGVHVKMPPASRL